MAVLARLAHAWNALVNLDTPNAPWTPSGAYGLRPDRVRPRYSGEKTIKASIYNRIAIDVSAVSLIHARLDDEDRYAETIKSGLQECLSVEANTDQAATAFRMDIYMTLFDEGVIALVPVDTTLNPNFSGSFDIKTMRVGKIVQWMPEHIRVSLYNEATGRREEVTLAKKFVAIVENPLYEVMNEPSSTLQRLSRKLSLLDVVDEATSSGKLDMIIQLPYVIKSESRKKQAELRRTEIEMQLKGSQYGIAYTDGTEKITQLNRPAENNLLKQVEYLTDMLYSQLGITKAVMDGTADEKVMLNYHQRTIKPLLVAVVEAMRRSFLTKTARSQGQTILFFRDAFSLVPMEQMAELADKLTRNEIITSNEFRGVLGFKPIKDKKADTLRNSNMPESELGTGAKPLAVQATAQRLDKTQLLQTALPAKKVAVEPPP